MTDLQRSHAELRAAVILAGKEIRKLNFGKANSPVLSILRRVLREAAPSRARRESPNESDWTCRRDGHRAQGSGRTRE